MFFKEKLLGNYVKYSKSTAKENPQMIKLYYENKLSEIDKSLITLSNKVKEKYIKIPFDSSDIKKEEAYNYSIRKHYYIDISKNKIFLDPSFIQEKIIECNNAMKKYENEKTNRHEIEKEYLNFCDKYCCVNL